MSGENSDLQSSISDPFKERLLNPFIFSLVLAFITRYRVELYDLFISSTPDSEKALKNLTIWDLELWMGLLLIIVTYLLSVGLGSMLDAFKVRVKRVSDSKFKKIIPVSSSEHLEIVSENRRLLISIRESREENLISRQQVSALLIKCLKRADIGLNSLQIIAPIHTEESSDLFVYSETLQTVVHSSLFAAYADHLICFPILRSNNNQLICVAFKINQNRFEFDLGHGTKTTPTLHIPTKYLDAQSWQKWNTAYYFDESSRSWSTKTPNRERFISAKINGDSSEIELNIHSHS